MKIIEAFREKRAIHILEINKETLVRKIDDADRSQRIRRLDVYKCCLGLLGGHDHIDRGHFRLVKNEEDECIIFFRNKDNVEDRLINSKKGSLVLNGQYFPSDIEKINISFLKKTILPIFK